MRLRVVSNYDLEHDAHDTCMILALEHLPIIGIFEGMQDSLSRMLLEFSCGLLKEKKSYASKVKSS